LAHARRIQHVWDHVAKGWWDKLVTIPKKKHHCREDMELIEAYLTTIGTDAIDKPISVVQYRV
jgi:hypothetical protein